jgi:Flp pilus assembly protein TadD
LSYSTGGGDNWFTRAFMGKRHNREAQRDAVEHFQELTSRDAKNGAAWFKLGLAQLNADDPRAAEEAFGHALELGHRKATTLYNLACAAARQDQRDRAFDYLRQSIDAGFDAAHMLRSDDDLDNLRGDPRLRDLIRAAKEKQRADADDNDD